MAAGRSKFTRWAASPAAKIAVAVAGAAVVIVMVVMVVHTGVRRVPVGEEVATDAGVITVLGWETSEADTAVRFRACRASNGQVASLGNFRAIVADSSLEPSGSSTDPESADCISGTVVFPTTDRVERVEYLASPKVVWGPV